MFMGLRVRGEGAVGDNAYIQRSVERLDVVQTNPFQTAKVELHLIRVRVYHEHLVLQHIVLVRIHLFVLVYNNNSVRDLLLQQRR